MPPQDTDTVDDERTQAVKPSEPNELQVQPAGFLIVMSLDWIILRASENVDDFLGELDHRP